MVKLTKCPLKPKCGGGVCDTCARHPENIRLDILTRFENKQTSMSVKTKRTFRKK